MAWFLWWRLSKNRRYSAVELYSAEGSISRPPDELYKNGIQRSSFIPCIELLKTKFDVINLDSETGKSHSSRKDCSILTLAIQITAEYPGLSPTFTSTHSPEKMLTKWIRSLQLLRLGMGSRFLITDIWRSGAGLYTSRRVPATLRSSTSISSAAIRWVRQTI